MINEDFTARSKSEDVGRWYVTSFVTNDPARQLRTRC